MADSKISALPSATPKGADLFPFVSTGSQSVTSQTTLALIRNGGVNAQTGTSYALASTDAFVTITMDNASANTVSVVASLLSAGEFVTVCQIGAGATTIDAATGVTVNGVDGGAATLSAQYDAATLYCIAADTYLLFGAHGGVA